VKNYGVNTTLAYLPMTRCLQIRRNGDRQRKKQRSRTGKGLLKRLSSETSSNFLMKDKKTRTLLSRNQEYGMY